MTIKPTTTITMQSKPIPPPIIPPMSTMSSVHFSLACIVEFALLCEALTVESLGGGNVDVGAIGARDVAVVAVGSVSLV